MSNKSDIDRLARDILKDSRLELTNPGFNQTVMKNVLHENRKQRILINLFLGLSVFGAVDTLVFFVIRFFNLDIYSVALWPKIISNEMVLRTIKMKESILQLGFTKYVILLLIVMAVADLLSGSGFKPLGGKK
jgi:hypothetical protein